VQSDVCYHSLAAQEAFELLVQAIGTNGCIAHGFNGQGRHAAGQGSGWHHRLEAGQARGHHRIARSCHAQGIHAQSRERFAQHKTVSATFVGGEALSGQFARPDARIIQINHDGTCLPDNAALAACVLMLDYALFYDLTTMRNESLSELVGAVRYFGMPKQGVSNAVSGRVSMDCSTAYEGTFTRSGRTSSR